MMINDFRMKKTQNNLQLGIRNTEQTPTLNFEL